MFSEAGRAGAHWTDETMGMRRGIPVSFFLSLCSEGSVDQKEGSPGSETVLGTSSTCACLDPTFSHSGAGGQERI